MHRFYLPQLKTDQNLIITKKEHPELFHQFKDVLRLEISDQCVFFNANENQETRAEVYEIGPKEFMFHVKEIHEVNPELTYSLTLIQAIPQKSEKWEWILQKGTELGVKNFVPLITERTQRRILPKAERMGKIIIEAVEQSGRVNIPHVQPPLALEDLTLSKNTHYFFASLKSAETLTEHIQQIHPHGSDIAIIIGPEGGFSPKEEDFLSEIGSLPYTLGERTLRLETAAIASIAIVSQH